MVDPVTSFLPDVDGLICAFELAPLLRRHGDVLRDEHVSVPIWLHFNVTDFRARRWIEQTAKLPEFARMFLLESDTRSRVDASDEGFGAVLGDLHHDFDSDPEGFGVVRLYVDSKYMISARTHPLKTVDVLRRELLAGHEPGSPILLFELLVERLAQTFEGVVAKLGDEVDDAEARILAGRYEVEGPRLGRIRRLLARLRRHINGNRSALAVLPNHLPSWCDSEQRRELRQVTDRLSAVAQDLDLVQERARLLQEEIAGRVGEATSRNLYVLSIVSAVLLPVTLITGIFGMNVTSLPFSIRPGGFWWVVGFILASTGTALHLLHRRRVL